MKHTQKQNLAIYSAILFSAGLSVSTAEATNYANPKITEISAALRTATPIAPNIFLMLDDSGSMSFNNITKFDENYSYPIPPNPDSFNSSIQEFRPFGLPTGNQNGFQENGHSFRNSGVQYNPRSCNPSSYTDVAKRNNCKIFRAFYSTPMLTLKSSLAIALTSESGAYFLDFDFINNSSTDSIKLLNMDRDSGNYYKDNMADFLESLYNENSQGYTPLRNETLKLFNKIRARATARTADNLFLPSDIKTYEQDKLLACKQNYSILLSDGEYNGGISSSLANRNNDFDAKINQTWTWQTSDTSTTDVNDTIDVAVTFQGDGTVPEQRLYAGGKPSLDRNVNRLTDIVFQAWAEDLNTSLANKAKPSIEHPGDKELTASDGTKVTLPEIWNPNNDPANWQRIVTYGIGFKLGDPITDTNLADIIKGKYSSTTTHRNGKNKWNSNRVTDFVRSGYVGRGGYALAKTPEALTQTFSDIFAEAIHKSGTSAASGTTASATQITTQSAGIVFSTEIDPGDRTGNLKGNWVYNGIIDDPNTTAVDEGEENGGVEFCYGVSSPPTNPKSFVGQLCTANTAKWSAIDELPEWDERKIFSYQPNTKKGISFEYNSMSNSQKNIIKNMFGSSKITSILQNRDYVYEQQRKLVRYRWAWEYRNGRWEWIQKPVYRTIRTRTNRLDISSETAKKIVDFIKGDNDLANNEDHNDIRNRPDGTGPKGTPLGDFGRGGPHFLGAPNNTIWKKKISGKLALTNKEKKRAYAFAGANDGMLHVFDAVSGKEIFAYIPNAVFKNLDKLVLAGKDHTAFVDGKIATQDINGGQTVLVAGMGAGAKGLFAIDVTDPSTFNKDKVLWEIDEKTDPRIGRIFGKPSIIRVEGDYKGKKNRWVVAVGTGYNNNNTYTDKGVQKTNEKNGILVMDAKTGTVLDFLALPGAKGVGELTWIDHQKHNNSTTFASYFGDDNQKNASGNDDGDENDSLWGEVDRGYVGDLTGNVWVIDFAYDANKSATTLQSAIIAGGSNDLADLDHIKLPQPKNIPDKKPAPLFIATDENGNRQPITSRITVYAHPSNRGYMVYFGTGELFDVTAFQPNVRNSMYGIWDDIGDNYGDNKTANMLDNNRTRDRFYLAYYPWTYASSATFDNGKAAFARVASDRTPVKWANFQGNGNSEAQNATSASRTKPSSGWVVNTGKNALANNQFERIFQAPYPVINQYNEEGITFLMSTLKDSADPCLSDSSAFTWNMTFRTDIIDGPMATFSGAQSDANRDGVIDKNDRVKVNNSTESQVALGAILDTVDITKAGVPSLEYSPTVLQSPRGGLITTSGAGNFCPSGKTRSYKKALSSEILTSTITRSGIVEEVNVCIPTAMSSWSEIE